MYLKKIAIKQIGPIDELFAELPFQDNGDPKPVVFVGENGSGKTILESQIVDSFYEIGSSLFEDVGVRNGLKRAFFKISGGINVQNGKREGFSLLQFIDSEKLLLEYFDKFGQIEAGEFKKHIKDFTLSPDASDSSQKEITNIDATRKEKLQNEWTQGVYFYQPAYRYEEPFWKNERLIDDVRYEDKKRFLGSVNKELEIISSTKNNKSFLMDLVLDFRHGSQNAVDQNTWNNINRILQAIKKRKDIRFGIGPRGRYRVGIVQDREDQSVVQILPSIDNLSLGESVLLNLFINIIRHGDNPPKATTDIQGIVVIDEIDVHLHTDLQNSVLPELIKLFPKVQFIITTHSPLFLLGMKEIFGEEGFEVRNMPKGEIITTERFSEFEHAYEALQKTKTFEDRINEQIATSIKPILFVEGDYDTSYLNAAGRLLRRMDLLEKIEIRDVNGSGGLDSIWRSFNHKKLSEIIPQKIILLYDCDTKKQDDSKGRVFKRIIPTVQDGILEKGIENLFDKVILRKAILNKKEYVDITPTFTKTIRGNDIVMPEKWEINEDEKGNLCDWICENGTEDDFNYFKKIFEIIETVINTQV